MEVQRAAGIAVVALEGGDSAEFGDFCDGDALEVHGGGAGDDVGRHGVVDLAERDAGDAHLFDLGGGFDQDGHKEAKSAKNSVDGKRWKNDD